MSAPSYGSSSGALPLGQFCRRLAEDKARGFNQRLDFGFTWRSWERPDSVGARLELPDGQADNDLVTRKWRYPTVMLRNDGLGFGRLIRLKLVFCDQDYMLRAVDEVLDLVAEKVDGAEWVLLMVRPFVDELLGISETGSANDSQPEDILDASDPESSKRRRR